MCKIYGKGNNLNKKAMDCWSFGHVVFGQITTLIALGIILLINNFISLDVGIITMLSTVGIMLLWEYLENGLLKKKKFFKSTVDSWSNSITDIVFGIIGMGSILISGYIFYGNEICYDIWLIIMVFSVYIFLIARARELKR